MMVKGWEKMRRWHWAGIRRGSKHPHGKDRSTLFNWEFPAENEPWAAQTALHEGNMPDRASMMARARRAQAIFAVIILLTCVTLHLWQQAETGAQLLEAEVRAAVATETRLTNNAQSNEPQAQIAAAPMSGQTITYHGDVLRGNIVSTFVYSSHSDPNGAIYTMRRRTFYRESEDGWARIEPDQAILGSLQQYETAFFTFVHYNIDAASVQAVSADLDALYASVRQDYGLPTAGVHMTILLSNDWPREADGCRKPNQLGIQSPALALLPPELSESDALHLWLLTALVYHARDQAIRVGQFHYNWSYAAAILPHMQIRQHSAPLSAWYSEFTEWLYSVDKRTPKPDEETLKQELAELCTRDEFVSRERLVILLASIGQCSIASVHDMRYLAMHKPPDQLSQFFLLDAEMMITEHYWMHTLAFETLLNYMVATYGRDKLPELIEGFRHYDSWETLVPEVFGISAEEFERGWQEHLHKLGQHLPTLMSK
jgi:hypothetical protein